MNCTLCGKPIVPAPSAAERAAKDVSRRPASYYTGLFTTHSECQLKARAGSTSELLRRLK